MGELGDPAYPRLLQTALDTTEPRRLAEFYRELFGFTYRPGDEPQPGETKPDWLVLLGPDGERRLAFQEAEQDARTTWPEPGGVLMQMHLDSSVPDHATFEAVHERVLALGGTLRLDRADDPDEALRVYADPAGHLFCVFVA